jgi:hypothetical protein
MMHDDVHQLMMINIEQKQIHLFSLFEKVSFSYKNKYKILPMSVTGTPYSSAAIPVHLPVPF